MAAEDYPYETKDGLCRFDRSKGLIAANGMTLLDEATPYQMQAALGYGPMSVALDASSGVFKFYRKGIFDHPDKCGYDLNHAVSIVGYSNNAEDAKPYWIMRNSWGTDWGEDGYMRIAITGGYGNCGINIEPSYPNIYFMNESNSVMCLMLAIFGVCLGAWPLTKLSWCKREDLLFLHEGQESLIKLSYILPVFFLVTSILFAMAMSPVTEPIWMFYRTGLIMLYAIVHIALTVLHC